MATYQRTFKVRLGFQRRLKLQVEGGSAASKMNKSPSTVARPDLGSCIFEKFPCEVSTWEKSLLESAEHHFIVLYVYNLITLKFTVLYSESLEFIVYKLQQRNVLHFLSFAHYSHCTVPCVLRVQVMRLDTIRTRKPWNRKMTLKQY